MNAEDFPTYSVFCVPAVMPDQPLSMNGGYDSLREALDVQARVLLVGIEIKPVPPRKDFRLDVRLEALDALDGSAWGIIMGKRGPCKDITWRLDLGSSYLGTLAGDRNSVS